MKQKELFIFKKKDGSQDKKNQKTNEGENNKKPSTFNIRDNMHMEEN